MNLSELTARLGSPIPCVYGAFVSRIGAESLAGSAASPAAICAVNLDARTTVPAHIGRSKFFLYETDTGNFLFISDIRRDGAAIKQLFRETGEIGDYDASPDDLLAELARTALPKLPSDAGVFVISKTNEWALSSLDPITLPELYVATSRIEGVAVFENRQYRNPLTAEVVTRAAPGVDIEVEKGVRLDLSLERGRLICHNRWPKQAGRLVRLAEVLQAKVTFAH